MIERDGIFCDDGAADPPPIEREGCAFHVGNAGEACRRPSCRRSWAWHYGEPLAAPQAAARGKRSKKTG